MNNRKKTDAFYEFSRIVYFKNFVYLCRRIIITLLSLEPLAELANNLLSADYKTSNENYAKYENNKNYENYENYENNSETLNH